MEIVKIIISSNSCSDITTELIVLPITVHFVSVFTMLFLSFCLISIGEQTKKLSDNNFYIDTTKITIVCCYKVYEISVFHLMKNVYYYIEKKPNAYLYQFKKKIQHIIMI